MHVAAALQQATAAFEAADIASPNAEAQQLLAHLLDCAPMELFFSRTTELSAAQEEFFLQACQRRTQREPLQHILGVAPFYGHDLAVGPGVFIPRPETEILAQWAITQAQRFAQPRVLDLCTGSGALALAIAHGVPQAQVTAVELSDAAARYARRNLADVARVVLADVTSSDLPDLVSAGGNFEVIVSNPPYVPAQAPVSPEVAYDPQQAVFSGASGMDTIRGMLPQVVRMLAPGGFFGVEHDEATQPSVLEELNAVQCFTDIRPLADFTGRPRFVVAQKVVE